MAKKEPKTEKSKVMHSWRLCPVGENWVKTHPLKIPPSKINPAGSITIRHGHCARNPTGKDQFYPDEIQEIAARIIDKFKRMLEPLNKCGKP